MLSMAARRIALGEARFIPKVYAHSDRCGPDPAGSPGAAHPPLAGTLLPLPCFPLAAGLCYNLAAVENTRPKEQASPAADVPVKASPAEALQYCPVCSQVLTRRSCKLICPACGYYMSCSDYY